MRFDILTLFPEMFVGPLSESILKRAQAADLLQIQLHDIRDYTLDRHRTADDAPYGGGAGMVLKPEPLAAGLRAVVAARQPIAENSHVQPPLRILLSPDGVPLTQTLAQELAMQPWLVLICGHYEGLDERFRETLVDREVSIGDYVLTGGELAAMVLVDCVARLVPGVIDHASITEESFGDGLLEYPHYTRPAVWEGQAVPPILVSGHHGEVARWRRQQRLRRTLERRPDLLRRAELSRADRDYLATLGWVAETEGMV